jgi:signal transduction histidine kinase/ligand-binding sensor domain-containing protein/DNA-binding response OmpR family regulator
MISNFKYFYLLLIGFVSLQLYSQKITISRDIRLIGSDAFFDRYFSSDGLPDDRIRNIFQDSRGFIWIGTMNGVSRYDGYTFKNFYKSLQTNSIVGNWVYAITEDSEHNIWLGTKEGLSKYDVKTDIFTNYKHDKQDANSLINDNISSLFYDENNQLWIGTVKGLSKMDISTRQFTNFAQAPFNDRICKIITSQKHSLLIATSNSLIKYQLNTGKYKVYPFVVKPNAYGDKVWSLLEVNNDVYIATGGQGLIRFCYDYVKKDYKTYESYSKFNNSNENLENTQIFDIRLSRSGDIWLATDRGLAKIDRKSKAERLVFFTYNNFSNRCLSNNQVYQVFIDRTNVLWCGTEYGLNKLDLYNLPFHNFTFVDKNTREPIRSITSPDGENLWLGTTKYGFYKYNILNGYAESYLFNPLNNPLNSCRTAMASNGFTYFGTLGGAVVFPSNSTNNVSTQIDGHAVFSVLRDRKNNLWYASYNGLYKVSPDGKIENYVEKIKFPKNQSFDFVRTLLEDKSGNIWLGFENHGIGYISPKNEHFYPVQTDNENNTVFGNIIYAMTENPKGTIWAGSESGLSSIQLETNGKYHIQNYFYKEGLPDKTISGIISGEDNSLWISTKKGFAKFNLKSKQLTRFMGNVAFTCCYKFSNNLFAFGTTEGFVIFNPKEIATNNFVPEVIISDLRLLNKSVAVAQKINGDVILEQTIQNTSEIKLNHNNNQFTLEFSALHFSNSNDNHYTYKMTGFDENWTQTTADNRSATYTNLNSGTYTFEVRACNNSGVWSTKTTKLKIVILPPPWKSWWAIFIYLFILSVIAYMIWRYALLDFKQKQQIRIDQMEKQQLKNMDQMKMRFFTDISHEFRTPLSLILGPVEELLSTNEASFDIKSKIQLVHRNSKKLIYLIDELMTFQKMEHGVLKLKMENCDIELFTKEVFENFVLFAKQKNINFNYKGTNKKLLSSVDKGKIEMVLNNLIFNSFKFVSKNAEVNVIVEICNTDDITQLSQKNASEWACITIQDNGRGILKENMKHLFERFYSVKSDNGTGVGLSLTKNLVELHNGVITAESEPNVSTKFKVYLPLITEEEFSKNVEIEHFVSEYDASLLFEEQMLMPLDRSLVAESTKFASLLIVDDNVEVLDFLEQILRKEYEIVRAENGIQALNLLAENLHPDLIISDVMMPEMDGVELCKAVKADFNVSHIPFILLSAKATIENKLEGLKTGADEYIAKPFHPALLKARVNAMIETQRRFLEKFKQDGGIVIPKDIAKNPQNDKFLQKVINLVNANMSNDEYSVEELGDALAMSRSNFFRKLKSITGQTPIEFIYYIRLKHAMNLLLERKLTISEISYEVGFKNHSSFTKAFKKQFGKSPTEYLNSAIKEKTNSILPS